MEIIEQYFLHASIILYIDVVKKKDSMNKNKIDLLLIEDSEVDGQLIKRILHKENLSQNYSWLKDGEQAAEYINDQNTAIPKAILLDLKLAKINGLEILKKIRSSARFKYIPVIIYSSSYIESDVKKAYKNGANSYLVKPTNLEEMKKLFLHLFNYWIGCNKNIGID